MGFDEPDLKQGTEAEQWSWQSAIDRFDTFLVRTEFDVRTIVRSMRVKAELLRYGYPRNDLLINGAIPADLARWRRAVGINPNDTRRLILYAPTFRKGSGATFSIPFDLHKFVEILGDRYVLLVRPHYVNKVAVPAELSRSVRNVQNWHDISQLFLISDALITDYSSVMYDYSLLDRPIILFTPDFDEYVLEGRGTYLDLLADRPGPLVRDEAALFSALDNLAATDEGFAEQRRAFAARYGEYDTGTAADAVVKRFFMDRGRHA
jgi:CDP-glycerol glycerophosphotransferase